jgi:hypothetical protein
MAIAWSPDRHYSATRHRARRAPTWWLRRRESRIVARRRPTDLELAELAAIRQELRIRAIKPRRWGRRS